MAIISRKNLYAGVNAHLNSLLQNTFAGWEEFHFLHINDLARVIDEQLPPGYVASAQRSFQINAITAEKRAETPLRTEKPDISIYDTEPFAPSAETATHAEDAAPTLTLTTAEVYENPEDYLGAVAIKVVDNHQIGEPVVWIELLSPTNKPSASGYEEYHQKRLEALLGGLTLVEIDYLHESRPVIRRLSRYPSKGSFPYYIAITIPRPTYKTGYVDIYGFHVDEPIPQIRIPLRGQDSVSIPFGEAYSRTFESLRTLSQRVDYAQEPPHMEAYSSSDREGIRACMTRASKGE